MRIDITLKITPGMIRDAQGSERKALSGHLGTHFDVMDKEFPLDDTEREGIVFDVSGVSGRDIDTGDIDLDRVKAGMFTAFFTGFQEKEGYGSRKYFTEHPQLSDDLIDALLDRGVSLIGVDCAGVHRGKEHTPKDQYCADRGVFIIENLCNLKAVLEAGGNCRMHTYPMSYAEMSGLPCRVIAEVQAGEYLAAGKKEHGIHDDTETIIKNAEEYIDTLFRGNSDGHDAAHSLRVYTNALKIAGAYPDSDRFVVSLAALLHDADDHKLFRTQNNANARSFLQEQNVDAEHIEQICEAINSVSFSKNRGRRPGTIEAAIVQDADRLDAIGAIGIARTFAFGGRNGRSLEDTLQHFYEKLLLLKDEMNTEEARRIAELRHSFMEDYLKEFYQETTG